jgi:integrase
VDNTTYKQPSIPDTYFTSVQTVDFAEFIRSPATKASYKQSLRQFQAETGFKLSPKTKGADLQLATINYIIRLKHKGKSYGRINGIVSAIQKFADVHDIELKMKKIRGVMPEHVRVNQDRAYTKEEIRTLVENSNPRVKALILLFVSTGIRAGAVPSLKIKDLSRLPDGCYKLKIYAGSVKYQYTVFLTIEATRAIEQYLKTRELKGEELKPNAPLFRREFSADDADKPHGISRNTVARLVEEVALRTGLREKSKGKRQEIELVHGFRKYFNTSLKRLRIDPDIIKLLMWGHAKGLQDNYLRLEEQEVYAEFKKAEPLLTISREPELVKEVEKLRLENARDIEGLRQVASRQAEEMKKQAEEIALLKAFPDVYSKMLNMTPEEIEASNNYQADLEERLEFLRKHARLSKGRKR